MIVIDNETTGLLMPDESNLYNQPHVTEIYALKVHDETLKKIDTFSTLLKVPVKLEDHIVRVTGITDEMLEDQPTFAEVYDDLCAFFLGETIVLGHNVNFDLDTIYNELVRIGCDREFPYCKERRCTIEMAYPINKKRMKLGDLYELATGKKIVNAHRAKSDVNATLKCYKWLLSEGF